MAKVKFMTLPLKQNISFSNMNCFVVKEIYRSIGFEIYGVIIGKIDVSFKQNLKVRDISNFLWFERPLRGAQML